MNRTIMQFFKWNLPTYGEQWNFLKEQSKALRGLMANTLTSCYPENSATFVDNHDTQPGNLLSLG